MRAYYGHFPVRHLDLKLMPQAGAHVGGTTYGFPAPHINVTVGEHATAASLRNDWVLTHEMVHLAFPSMGGDQAWIEEGIATYVEPIARTQVGQLDRDEVWRQLIEGLPKGLPAAGDKGLDNTHTWGRTYWGGALFCLLAEIRIRQQTKNAKGLQDALRGIITQGGSIESDWSIAHALEFADAATGTKVLSELYRDMRATPVDVDLDALWRQLGVSLSGRKVGYDEKAPLAAIRRAITEPHAPG